ncbi:MAG: UDP-N-acetylmuramoyl-tripeptide--D-alanyl-D-alanine ligase [Planctomycetes bacterium]|nr:UDP-N-acetylmuramoyl-tripeptide--D-alanyl-D-alanine ligase [Planctomycetota bacterium]
MIYESATFTAEDICEACGGHIIKGRPEVFASGISVDSRTINPVEAFLALKGSNHDGHNFVKDALKSGASIVITERRDKSWDFPHGTALILVANSQQALMDLASWHRSRLEGKILAVTGSCGKSTVKNMTASILALTGSCSAAPKSFNNRIGVSLSLLAASQTTDFVVLELGTNHPGEIDELAAIARPNAGLITCIGESHLEGLGSKQGVQEAKAELIPHIKPGGCLVLNADDPLCRSLAGRYSGEVKTFGLHRTADMQPVDVRSEGEKQFFRARGSEFRLNVPGRHNVLNAAAAICLSRWAGAGTSDAIQALAGFQLPDLRSEKREVAGIQFILDCYNSNPTAMKAALESFLQRPAPRRRIVVCGDMLELGEKSKELHHRLGRVLALTRLDVLVAVGSYARDLVAGWRDLADTDQKALHVEAPEKAWLFVAHLVAPGDVVLVKGSRALELEKIVNAIEQFLSSGKKEAAA